MSLLGSPGASSALFFLTSTGTRSRAADGALNLFPFAPSFSLRALWPLWQLFPDIRHRVHREALMSVSWPTEGGYSYPPLHQRADLSARGVLLDGLEAPSFLTGVSHAQDTHGTSMAALGCHVPYEGGRARRIIILRVQAVNGR